MTDAHCHVSGGDPSVRELLIGRDFAGTHPWETNRPVDVSALRARLAAESRLGVGEIGLDRLRQREISVSMRAWFEAQLDLAAEFRRPAALHGAKCWGQVVNAILRRYGEAGRSPIPSLLFHGFSRSDGLVPDIVRLNGFVSVGPAVLNDHAVNYREMVRRLPADRLLVETDRTPENAASVPSAAQVAAKVAELRGVTAAELEAQTDRNADAFMGSAG